MTYDKFKKKQPIFKKIHILWKKYFINNLACILENEYYLNTFERIL